MMNSHAEITFRPKRLLSERDFAEYLSLVRQIADFDSENKRWVYNPIKTVLTINSFEELLKLLGKLIKYVKLSQTDVYIIKKSYLELKETADVLINIDKRGVTLIFNKSLSNDVLTKIDNYIIKITDKEFKLVSPIYINKVINILKEYNNNVIVEDKRLNSLMNFLKVNITRNQGRLEISVNKIDRYFLKELREICTLTYYKEKVILDEEKNYKGTELIERKLTCLDVDFSQSKIYVPVGLLHRIVNFLEDLEIPYSLNIKEKDNINIQMKINFTLYPHQKEAYIKWLECRRGTIAIFTRGGKSFIALRAIYDLKKPTIIFVTTRELATTWKTYLTKYLGIKEYEIGYLGEGVKKITPITISTYVSGVKYIEDIKDKFELVIFDEGHHLPAESFKKIALKIDALYRMVLTATPYRRDRNEVLIFSLCGDLVANIDYISLLKMKIVAPIEVFKAVFAIGQEDKLNKLIEILNEHKDEQTLVFTQYIDTAKKLYFELLKRGFKVALITGEVNKSKRERFFRDFVKGLIKVLVTTTVLDEGITAPDAEVAIIYEGTGEERQMIQRIGRVLGYKPGKKAKIYEIIDITNPKEKVAYLRRKSVREYYRLDLIRKIMHKDSAQTLLETFY